MRLELLDWRRRVAALYGEVRSFDDPAAAQVVAGVAAAPRLPADAAGQGQPGDAGGGDDADRDREPVLGAGGVEVVQEGAALDGDPPRRRIDAGAAQPRHVDHEAAIAAAEAGDVVAAAADRQRRLDRGQGGDGAGDVGLVAGAEDGDRAAVVVHPVPDLARPLVLGVAGGDHLAAERGPQFGDDVGETGLGALHR